MGIRLTPERSQLSDLKRISEIGADQIASVSADLNRLEEPVLDPNRLLDFVKERVGKQQGESLVRQALALRGLVRQGGHSVDEVVSAVTQAVEDHGESILEIGRWRSVESAIATFLNLKSVRLTATAIELAYDYANLLRRAKILTDIRPLYDENRTSIEGALVSYTLRIRFDSGEGEKELSIALDSSDVSNLRDECCRALSKARIAEDSVKGGMKIPVVQSGGSNDGA